MTLGAPHLRDDRLLDCYLASRHGEALDPPVAEHLTDCDACGARYEELVRRGCHNPEIFRNLGNIYLMLGDLPRSILSFRRGIQLAPDDAKLNTALHRARQGVVYARDGDFGRPPRGIWLAWFGWFSYPHPRPQAWSMAVSGYLLFCISAADGGTTDPCFRGRLSFSCRR